MAQHGGRHAGGRAGTWAGLRAGGRLRRGGTGAVAAVVALAALTASQAEGDGAGDGDNAGVTAGRGDAPAEPRAARGNPVRGGGPPGDGYYHTELPPVRAAEPGRPASRVPGAGGAESGIPETVLAAYRKTARLLGAEEPGCGVRWELLAAVGKVESGQARGGALDDSGGTVRPLLGPVLNGAGVVRVADTDGGKWDGDAEFDRAVGPLQFVPSTWAEWGADGNADGRREPGNIHDAALAAGRFLCAKDRDLSSKAGRDAAVLAYNDSRVYLRTVLSWAEYYRAEAREVPDGSGPLPTSPGAGAEGGGVSAERSASPSAEAEAKSEAVAVPKPAPSAPSSPAPDGTVPGTPAPVVPAAVERLGQSRMTAAVGESFTGAARVRVVDERGRPVEGVRVRYEVVGVTGARFAGTAEQVTVTTGRHGTAVAPVLAAGASAGAFTVEASVDGREVPAVEFGFTVGEARAPADTLARVEQEPLTARPGSVFGGPAGPLRVRATRGGEAVPGARVSARMPGEEGPFFVGAKGEPVRSLPDLATGADGVLELPELRAGSRQGSFELLLTAPGGARLTVGLTVSAG